MRAIVFFIFFPIATLAQTNFISSDMYESNFQLVQREIASVYNPKTTTFTGNKYFYKKPQEAVLVLFDGEEPIKVKTNYNLLDQTFDIEGEDNILKLEPNRWPSSYSERPATIHQVVLIGIKLIIQKGQTKISDAQKLLQKEPHQWFWNK